MSIDGTPIMVDEQLSGAGAYINNAAAQIAEELHSLITQLQPLADSWTGPAASYFDPLMAEWNYAANGLFGTAETDGVLGEIAAAMHVAWGNYSDAEWANAGTWKPSA
jgi:WXG100 family type VII secretion target